MIFTRAAGLSLRQLHGDANDSRKKLVATCLLEAVWKC
jgi:hypothetical protein